MLIIQLIGLKKILKLILSVSSYFLNLTNRKFKFPYVAYITFPLDKAAKKSPI